jgi:hypothetical protein
MARSGALLRSLAGCRSQEQGRCAPRFPRLLRPAQLRTESPAWGLAKQVQAPLEARLLRVAGLQAVVGGRRVWQSGRRSLPDSAAHSGLPLDT